ncbi:MAG: divergent PAP2 family protein [Termitinemataceae bacterium]|nr:MAG: divergent PAP2 family protein [Termitinemataceae bacterium]
MSNFLKLEFFFENPIVLSVISSFVFAQVIKVAIAIASKSRKTMRDLLHTFFWKTGGMPSSHASLVSSLTTSIGIREGMSSNLFIVTLFFALLVLRDAVGVRHSSGMQAKSLNSLGRKLFDKFSVDYTPVKEVQGHTVLEVLVGCFLGIFIAAGYAYL